MPEAVLGRLRFSTYPPVADECGALERDDSEYDDSGSESSSIHSEADVHCSSMTWSTSTTTPTATATGRRSGMDVSAPLRPAQIQWLSQLSNNARGIREGRPSDDLLLPALPSSWAACATPTAPPLGRQRSVSCSGLDAGLARVQQEMRLLQSVVTDRERPEESYRLHCAQRVTKSRASIAPWEMAQLKLLGTGLMLPGYNSLLDYVAPITDEAMAASVHQTLRGIDSLVQRVTVTVTDAHRMYVKDSSLPGKGGRGEAASRMPRGK